MGCAGSSGKTAEVVDYKNVPPTNSNYPPPRTPETTRAEKYDKQKNKEIQDRIDTMPKGTDGSYTPLLKYLSTGATKEIHHVTAIYLWMKSQDYNSPELDLVKPGDTPRGYMKMIKDGEGDLTTFFTILCRRSGIPCVILSGLGKDDDYMIGWPEQKMDSRWCAPFADDEWHLAHIEWAIKKVKDGNQNTANKQIADFFFLPDPDEFITICLPDTYQWQLVDKCISKKEFLGFPSLRPYYYLMDGNVIAPKSGTVKTRSGKTDVELSFPRQQMEDVHLAFMMHYIRDSNGSGTHNTALDKLGYFVFMNRKASRFIFEICLPEPGKYLFDIYGNYQKKRHKRTGGEAKSRLSGLERLCQFRIISDRKYKEDEEEFALDPLPENPEIGWGPGPVCRHLGLVPLSHYEGCIYMKPGEVRDLRFRMLRDLDVQCQLVHNFLPVYDLVDQVECTTSGDEVQVRVQIPEEGQYALKIFCRDAGTKEFEEACVYLLRQRQKSRLPEKIRDKMLRNRLEYHITNHTSEKELEDAMDWFRCYNVPDQGETNRGKEKLKEYWEIKRELRAAVLGRNLHHIRRWNDRAKRSPYEPDLREDIQKADLMDQTLVKRRGHRHPIAQMDEHTMLEIRNYKRPPKVVHDVMKSTYLLLGEDRDDLEDWEQIQYVMGQTGKDQLQKRIVARRPEDVHIEVADEADNVIKPYSLQKCRAVSNGICSFYKWDRQFIRDVKRRYQDDQEREEANRKLSGRETFRDTDNYSRLSTPESSKRYQYKGRSDPNEEDRQNQHPFGVDENEAKEDENAKNKMGAPELFVNAMTPTESRRATPVSYAGFKPRDSDT